MFQFAREKMIKLISFFIWKGANKKKTIFVPEE